MKSYSLLGGIVICISIIACGGGGSDPDPIVTNRAPIANASVDINVVEMANVTLDGSASSDSDGSIVSYQWTQVSGTPTVTLTNATAAMASFTAPDVSEVTTLVFQLTVTDDDGASGTDTISVTITPDLRPTAVAPQDFQAVQNSTVTLDGSGSNDDVAISSYLWQQTAGETVSVSNANSAVASFDAPSFDPLQSQVLTFELTVTDAMGQTSVDSVNVTIVEEAVALTISGQITYDHVKHNSVTNGLDHSLTTQDPVRGATIELLNDANDAILATRTTDASGEYSFEVSSGETYRIRVKAELLATGAASWNFTVVDNTQSDALYAVDSDAISMTSSSETVDINMDSGWTGAGYGNPRVAGPFAILDSVYQAVVKIVNADPNADFPALKLHWSVNNINTSGASSDPCVNYDSGEIGTSFFTTRSSCPGVYILGDANSDTDEYDGHVVVHEWGHYFENKFSRADSIGGSHSLSSKLDMRVALGEGFGNAFAGIVTDDSVYRDSFGTNQSSGFNFDIENNPGISGNRGWFSEDSVQSVLYDIYDASNEGADNLTLGFTPIYQALVGGQSSTDSLTSIFSLAQYIIEESPANSSDIEALLASQDINSAQEFAIGETNNDGKPSVLPVYKVIDDNGVSVEVCSDGDNGQYNRLGNRQFIAYGTDTTQSVTITVNGQNAGDDPDMIIHRAGDIIAISEENGNELYTATFSPGIYILEIYEYSNVDSQQTPKLSCIDVTLTSI